MTRLVCTGRSSHRFVLFSGADGTRLQKIAPFLVHLGDAIVANDALSYLDYVQRGGSAGVFARPVQVEGMRLKATIAASGVVTILALALVLSGGCGTAESSEHGPGHEGNHHEPTASSAGRATVGSIVAETELQPVGGSSTRGSAVLRGVGSTDVQVELSVRGLPKDPKATYYAQAHEGSCSDEPSNKENGAADFALAFLRLDLLLAEGKEELAHGGHERGIPEEPLGSIEQPVSFDALSDGTASVTSLLAGVNPDRFASGGAKYVHVHASGSKEEEIACGDLTITSRGS